MGSELDVFLGDLSVLWTGKYMTWIYGAAFTAWTVQTVASFAVGQLFPRMLENEVSRQVKKGHDTTKWNLAWGLGTRVASLVFTAYFAFAAVKILLTCPPTLADDVYATYEPSLELGAIATGYFLWDVVLVFVEGWPMTFKFHAIGGFLLYLFSLHPFLPHMAAVGLSFELSTPLMHIRRLFIETGNGSHWMTTAVGYLFAVVFFVVRILYGYWQSFLMGQRIIALLQQNKAHSNSIVIFYFVFNILFAILNGYWFKEIFATATGTRAKTSLASEDATPTLQKSPKKTQKD